MEDAEKTFKNECNSSPQVGQNKRKFDQVQSSEPHLLLNGMFKKKLNKKKKRKAESDKVVTLHSPQGSTSTFETQKTVEKMSTRKRTTDCLPKICIDLEQLFSAYGKRPGGHYLNAKDIQDLIMFSVLGGGRWTPPSWCHLLNHQNIQQTLFIMANGLSSNFFLEFTGTFKHVTSYFNQGYAVKNDGSDTHFVFPLESFLFYRMKKMSAKKKARSTLCRLLPHDLILSEGRLMANNFPIASEMPENEREGYVTTKVHRESFSRTNACSNDVHEEMCPKRNVFAIDCEMCKSADGPVLARVSIINENCDVVYDTFVKPKEQITDYVTQYSGITPALLANVNTTIGDVQERILELISADDIILGHSLEYDIRALKIFHKNYIDTSVIYGDQRGTRFKPSLRSLVKLHLRREIQNDVSGHCSIEDAKACMELLQLKLEKGLNFGVFENFKESMFEAFSRADKKCAIVCNSTIARQHCFGQTKAILCSTDDQAVAGTRKSIKDSDFVFAQLKDFEDLLKGHDTSGNKSDKKTIKEVLATTDRNIGAIIESAPKNTLIVLLFGSGFIPQHIMRLQRDSTTRFHDEVKSAVKNARDCMTFIQVKT